MRRRCLTLWFATVLFLCSAAIHAQEPFRDLGRAHDFPQERFVEQSVWLPYWAERDHHHSTLHVRNVMLHTPLDIQVEIYSAAGSVIANESARLDPAGNLDFELESLVSASLAGEDRAGAVRISFLYPLAGVVQAEVSVLDNHRNHAYTIVGRPAQASEWNSAYLAFRWPTSNTYLELAFFNPLDKEVSADLSLLTGADWQAVESFRLRPREMRKLRVPAMLLAQSRTAPESTSLLRAVYSVSATEVVANVWLEDETTGFSNTVLFHEGRPQSNMLYGSQLVAHGYPRDLLPDGPDFTGHLVLANAGGETASVTPTLYCEIGEELVEKRLPAREIEPETVVSIPLNDVVAEQFGQASGTICSVEAEFTGEPGEVFGRYFGESSTLTYGLYSKLEAGMGRAYNELYWSVEGDRMPLLTVTNFSDSEENIRIWATRDADSKLLRELQVPAKASIHLNMQREFTDRAATLDALKVRAYGGFHIRAESPTAKILVKEHIFSLSRQVASPYYGGPDIIISHHIQNYPPDMVVNQNATAETMTCYYSGCYWNGWQINSFDPSIVSTQAPPGSVPRPITAHQTGNATLYSSAIGPINVYGDEGEKEGFAIISVYDTTPVIGAIVPNTIPAGGSQIAEIYGTNFGTNPTVSATGGITVTHLYKSPTQINVQFHAPATPPGSYSVTVTSTGHSGTGFMQAPGGGGGSSQPESNEETVQVQQPCDHEDKSSLYNEYRNIIYGTAYRPECNDFSTNVSTTNFTFSELNTSNTYTYGIFKSSLTDGVECVRLENGGTPLTINSAYRGPAKNSQVGGATESRHIYGDAVDFHAPSGSTLRNNVTDNDDIKTTCNACREPLHMTSTWIHFDWRAACPSGW